VGPTGTKLKAVWAITDRGGRSYRTRVGVAWESEDGTLTARLDALPMSGQLTIEDWVPPAVAPRTGAADTRRPEPRS
jgi:hypothetical protein